MFSASTNSFYALCFYFLIALEFQWKYFLRIRNVRELLMKKLKYVLGLTKKRNDSLFDERMIFDHVFEVLISILVQASFWFDFVLLIEMNLVDAYRFVITARNMHKVSNVWVHKNANLKHELFRFEVMWFEDKLNILGEQMKWVHDSRQMHWIAKGWRGSNHHQLKWRNHKVVLWRVRWRRDLWRCD